MEKMIKIGSVGKSTDFGVSAIQWDESGHNDLTQIFVSNAETIIQSIQFQYIEKGTSVMSPVYGRNTGNGGNTTTMFNVVELNYPKEFLTGVSGGYIGGSAGYVASITFTTNLGKYGPFGKGGNKFDFQFGRSNQFGGFFGSHTSGELSTIGVFLKPRMIRADVAGNIKSVKH